MRGRVVAKRYRLESLLGQGGGGVVWRAVHLDLGTPAAVKLLNPGSASGAETLGRFKREAKAAASLRCSNVVQILDYGVDDGTPYIAMELLHGDSLAEYIARQGRVSPAETATILQQVARALDLAHSQGIVHRDLKPDNVFLAREGSETVVKVLDFGIAKFQNDIPSDRIVEDTVQTQTGTVLGTPYYMSLEQVIGEKTVDHRTDIWAMAVIACECLTSRRPFPVHTFGAMALLLSSSDRPRPSEMASVPVGFDRWFARCTARDVNDRYSSIKTAAEEFCDLVAAGLVTPEPSVDEPARLVVGVQDTTAAVEPIDGLEPPQDKTLTAPLILQRSARRAPRFATVTPLALGVGIGTLLLIWGLSSLRSAAPVYRIAPGSVPSASRSTGLALIPTPETDSALAPHDGPLVVPVADSSVPAASTSASAPPAPSSSGVPFRRRTLVVGAAARRVAAPPSAAVSAARENARRRVGF